VSEILKFASSPRLVWKSLQGLVADLYISASKEAYLLDNPLVNVEVIFDLYCGYDPWVHEQGDGFDSAFGFAEGKMPC
jgi:hypothetical protein